MPGLLGHLMVNVCGPNDTHTTMGAGRNFSRGTHLLGVAKVLLMARWLTSVSKTKRKLV